MLKVDNSGGQAYTTIQAAIDAAGPGDTVYLYNGVYSEELFITKAITLTGESKDGTIINGTWNSVSSTRGIDIGAASVNVNNLKIEGFDYGVTVLYPYSVTMNDVVITNASHSGIYSEGAGSTFSGCSVSDCGEYGIHLVGGQGNTFSNNTVEGCAFGIMIEKDQYGGWPSIDNVFDSNIVRGSGYANASVGIYMKGYRNTFTNNQIWDINCSGGTAVGIYIEGNHSVFSGNTISGITTTAYNGTASGIDFITGFNNTFAQNTITDINSPYKSYGVLFGNGYDVISSTLVSQNLGQTTFSDNTITGVESENNVAVGVYATGPDSVYSGNTISGTFSEYTEAFGLYLEGAAETNAGWLFIGYNNTVRGNTITNTYGKTGSHGALIHANDTEVSNNTITGADFSLEMKQDSTANKINNNIFGDNKFGVLICGSNTIYYNTLTNASLVLLLGDNTAVGNTINGEPFLYYKNINATASSPFIIDGINTNGIAIRNCTGVIIRNVSINGGGIMVDSSRNNKITSNNISSNWYGVVVVGGGDANNEISSNMITNCHRDGIYLYYSDGSMVFENTITGCKYNGILVSDSSHNSIFANDIYNNTQYGILVESGHNNTASANWWGDQSGPKAAANPLGTGDNVSGTISVSSWFSAAASAPGDSGAEPQAPKTIIVDNSGGAEYTHIQDAINAANEGDTIYIKDGNYAEEVVVYKQLTISAESPGAVIDGGGAANSTGIRVISDGAVISGLSVQEFDIGIVVYSANGARVESVSVSDSTSYGIFMSASSNSTITSSTVEGSGVVGIYIEASSANSTVSSNEVSSSGSYGIYAVQTSGDVISSNTVINSSRGISLSSCSRATVSDNNITSGTIGVYVSQGSNNTVGGNIISNNSDVGISLSSTSNNAVLKNTVSGSTNASIALSSSSYNNVSSNAVNDSAEGISLSYSSKNTVLNNTANDCTVGIYLSHATENNVSKNDASDNADAGIFLNASSNSNVLWYNDASSNGGEGVSVLSSSSNRLEANTMRLNEAGVELNGSNNNRLVDNTMAQNNYSGVSITSSANNNLTQNNIFSNSQYGVSSDGSAGNKAWDNWWGDASGPNNSTTNPSGTGNAVNGSIQAGAFAAAAYNHPPDIEPISDYTVCVGSAFRLQVVAKDRDWDVMTYSSAPDAALSSFVMDSYGFITFTPTLAQKGASYQVFIYVGDGKGTSAAEFNIAVPNRPPIVAPIANSAVYVGASTTLQVNATDMDGDALAYGDDTSVFDIDYSTGAISFTPRSADRGIHAITISVSDGTDSTDVPFNLTVPNRPPEVQAPLNQTAYVGANFTLRINATDADGDNLTYSDDTPLFEINATTGIIRFVPSRGDRGIRAITVNVSDGIDSALVNFTLVIPNRAPALSQAADCIVEVGTEFSYQINATDLDGDPIALASNTGNISNGTLYFAANQTGEYNVSITANDSIVQSVMSFSLSVQFVNHPPRITAMAAQNATAGTAFSHRIVAADSDGDAMEYTDDTALFSINRTSGQISFTPRPEDVGRHNITIYVTDGSATVNATFSINIAGAPNIPPAVAPTSSFTENVAGVIVLAGTASDDGSVQYIQVRVDGGEWMNATGTSIWNYLLDTTALSDGAHTVEVRAYDGAAYSPSQSISITTANAKGKTDSGLLGGSATMIIVAAAAIAGISAASAVYFFRGKKQKAPGKGAKGQAGKRGSRAGGQAGQGKGQQSQAQPHGQQQGGGYPQYPQQGQGQYPQDGGYPQGGQYPPQDGYPQGQDQGQYPPQEQAQGGYPDAAGGEDYMQGQYYSDQPYGQYPQDGGYPQGQDQGQYPPQQQGEYPQDGSAQEQYPPQAQSQYPPQDGYPQGGQDQEQYPPQQQGEYPPQEKGYYHRERYPEKQVPEQQQPPPQQGPPSSYGDLMKIYQQPGQQPEQLAPEQPGSGRTFACPFCGNLISRRDKKCPYCKKGLI